MRHTQKTKERQLKERLRLNVKKVQATCQLFEQEQDALRQRAKVLKRRAPAVKINELTQNARVAVQPVRKKIERLNHAILLHEIKMNRTPVYVTKRKVRRNLYRAALASSVTAA